MEEQNSVEMGESSQDSDANDIVQPAEESAEAVVDSGAPADPAPQASSEPEQDDESGETVEESLEVAAESPADEAGQEEQQTSEEPVEPSEEPVAELASEHQVEAEPSQEEPQASEEPVESSKEPVVELASEEQVEAEADSPVEPEEDEAPAEPVMVSMADFLSDKEPEEEPPAEVEAAEEPEEDDGRAWYVVHCYSGYENKVRHNLEQRIDSMGMKNLIFDVVVPTEEEIEVKEGKRRTVERRVFPGYILVNMIMGEESWYVVRNTPGVTSFVGMGEEPIPLRPEEVSQIIKRMEADAPRIKVTFRQGERVRIIDGPFNDFRGTVDEIDMERAKVRVMVNFFGRETPVELDFLQVEKS